MKHHTTVKIPVHSLIDLITNSSTEIFVDSTNSVEPAKALLTEFLKLAGSDKTCDEVFEITIENDEQNVSDYFEYHLQWESGDVYNEYQDNEKRFVEEYCSGKITEDFDFEIDDYHIQKLLVIKVKDEKYANIPDLLEKFLYSPEYYEYNN